MSSEIIGLGCLAILVLLWRAWIAWSADFGAPFVPMEPRVVKKIIHLAKIKKGDVFYDLGSGDGRLVIAAAMQGAKAYGVEIDPLRAAYSRFWIWLLRLKNAQIIRRDFFKVDLSKADIISLFLLQETNQKLKEKLKKELKPKAKLISYSFTFENWRPQQVSDTQGIYGPLYLYQIEKKPQKRKHSSE